MSSPTRTCRSSRRRDSCRPSATPAPRRSSSTPSCWPARSTSTPHALFQTDVTGAEWDEEARRWQVTTSRGDRLSSRFLVLAGGILHKAKLAGNPRDRGLRGQGLPHQPLGLQLHRREPHRADGQTLADKRVGIIGTGATAVQVVPQIARVAKELYVFQRTPGAVGRPQPAAHRRRVVPEPRARLAAGADRQLHPGGDRRPARGGPGE